ncbi:hypothetical protein [Halalkalicoccus paucihalophilus]|nr:hypothetical protein [Halalkalicoccus paucihalophilus]
MNGVGREQRGSERAPRAERAKTGVTEWPDSRTGLRIHDPRSPDY